MTTPLEQAARQVLAAWDDCGHLPSASYRLERLGDYLEDLRSALEQQASPWHPASEPPKEEDAAHGIGDDK